MDFLAQSSRASNRAEPEQFNRAKSAIEPSRKNFNRAEPLSSRAEEKTAKSSQAGEPSRAEPNPCN
jgi:hypothetical protein